MTTPDTTTDDQTQAVLDLVDEFLSDEAVDNDAAIKLFEALAPALAAIRRHAAATALRAQATRLGKIAAACLTRASEMPKCEVEQSWRDFAQQARTDGRMLLRAADDVIAEGWTETCAAETPATWEDPAEGCETPVENEGDHCPRHEDDRDPDRDDR